MQGTTYPGGHITWNAMFEWAWCARRMRRLNELFEGPQEPYDWNESQPMFSPELVVGCQRGDIDTHKREEYGQATLSHTLQVENNDFLQKEDQQ